WGLALPVAISCSSPFLSIGARQPVSAVFWATAVISFSPWELGYRTVCFLHEACQMCPKSKGEVFEPLRSPCPFCDQLRLAQTRCKLRAACDYFERIGRCDLMNSARSDYLETHGQSGQSHSEVKIGSDERTACRR